MTPLDIVMYSWIMDRIEYGGGNMTDVTNGAIAAGVGMNEYSVRKRKQEMYLHDWLSVVRQGGVVYCGDPDAYRKSGVWIPPKVSSRKLMGMRTNLDRF